jgi:hypothetical protein
MSQELIIISQLPVIEEQLKAIKERWEAKAAEAAAMICTEETVQALKSQRAEMRKEFEEADTQRKAVKARYMEPWDKVEATFKACVKDAFTRADSSLKGSIAAFEKTIKDECEKNLREYFAELIAMEGLDWLTYEQAMSAGNLKISLGDAKKATPRQLQDALALTVSRIAIAVQQITLLDDAAEVMAEYKQNLDVGKSIATVQSRKRVIAAEKEAAEARRTAQEAQAAAVERVMPYMPAKPAEAPTGVAERQETLYPEFTFTVFSVTKTQLLKIRDFLRQEGIRYE